MYRTFVVLAYLRRGKEPVEIDYASSYDEACRLMHELADRPACVENVDYFRIEGRYYV